MGLCKCPKRRVTNQFCFEHRVNVCEYCMISNHPQCIVQSYLLWLQDSDYHPICELCTKELASGDCIRLICYHVFHWDCINKYALQLPPTTAPAGYICPSCRVGIFPQENVISPVADIVREKLAGVNWARAGLGLPLLADDKQERHKPAVPVVDQRNNVEVEPSSPVPISAEVPTSDNLKPPVPAPSKPGSPTHSVIVMDDSVPTFSRTEGFPVSGQAPRRVFEALDESRGNLVDHDENKYNRRSIFEFYFRWWRSLVLGTATGRFSKGRWYRRYILAALLIALGLVLIVGFLSKMGRIMTEDDPLLDPLQNANIHVKEQD